MNFLYALYDILVIVRMSIFHRDAGQRWAWFKYDMFDRFADQLEPRYNWPRRPS